MRQSVFARTNRSFTPSFRTHIEEDRRIWYLVAEQAGVHDFSIWPFLIKGAGIRETVDSIDLAAPQVLCGPVPSGDVPWNDLPPSFVVKPSTGASSRGVCVMRRCADGSFDDLLNGRRWNAAELVHHYQQLPGTARHVLRDEVLVEELVECGGRPSYDWKLYTFRGEITLLCQIDRLGGVKRYKYYLPDGSPVRHVFYGHDENYIDDSLPPPTRLDELLRTAAALSLAVPVPFVRADLYESDTGVLVGELTPFPGDSQSFTPEWDRIFGTAWERGEAALRMAGVPRYRLPQRAEVAQPD